MRHNWQLAKSKAAAAMHVAAAVFVLGAPATQASVEISLIEFPSAAPNKVAAGACARQHE